MRYQAPLAVFVICALALVASEAYAQSRAQSSGQGQQMDRGMDRSRERVVDPDIQRNRERLDSEVRAKGKAQVRQPSQVRDRDIYGHELMSAEERNEYHNRLESAASIQAKEQIRAEHQAKMEARAKAKGVDLAPASEGPIYGGALMSVEERNEYREQLRSIESDEERGKFVAEHREEMQLRAKAQGRTLDEIEVEEAE